MMMGGVANVMSTPTIVPAMQLPPTADTVASDAFIKVLGQTTALPDRTEVKLFLQCTTSAGVRNVSLQLEPPPALRATLTATPPAEARGNRVTLSMLGAGLASTTASITCIGPLLFDLALQGQLSYADAGSAEPHLLPFKLALTTQQLLRPHSITTQQFGQLWPAHSAEWKGQAYSSCGSNPQAFMSLLERSFALHPVEIIGVECIACGKLVGSDQMVLVHGKLGLMAGRALELTVRTREKRFTESLQRQLIEAIQRG